MEDEEKGSVSKDQLLKVDKSASCASSHPVVGRIISDKVLNSEEVISMICKEWTEAIYGKVDIKHVKGNTYLFSFKDEAFAEKVILHGPWVILGHFLCLKHWESHMNLEEVAVRYVPIWVQVHGLTWTHKTEENYAKYIGNRIGTSLRSKWSWRPNYLRVRVWLDCYSVVKTGMWIGGGDGRRYHVDFEYERMADLCFNCGRFGHGTKECRKNKIPHPQFGPWLRATRAPTSEDEDKDDERKILLIVYMPRLGMLAIIIFIVVRWIILLMNDPS